MESGNNKINYSNDNANRLMIKAAWLHFKEDLTQGQIAERLGISRIKVNRLINQAKTSGIVSITVQAPIPTYNDIEEQLVKRFNLQEAVVVMDSSDSEGIYQTIAQGTADWLVNHISSNLDIGISLGRTLSHLPNAYFSSFGVGSNFIDIIGNIPEFNSNFGSYNVAARMAERFGGQALRLNAPTVASSPLVVQVIKEEPYIRDVLNRARNCKIILLGCGPVDHSMLLFMHNFIDQEDVTSLKKRGAVGDVLTHFMDKSGNHIESPLEGRVIGLTLEEIRKIPQRVLISSGKEKVPIMAVALNQGIFSVLITNRKTAVEILNINL